MVKVFKTGNGLSRNLVKKEVEIQTRRCAKMLDVDKVNPFLSRLVRESKENAKNELKTFYDSDFQPYLREKLVTKSICMVHGYSKWCDTDRLKISKQPESECCIFEIKDGDV
ncbi:hypothetical protein [Archaeoglobus sp.]